MQLKELHLKRFRCVLDQCIPFDSMTAIVGPNGAGKSTALRAIREFYTTTRTITAEDFYHRDMSEPIEISLTFADLSDAEAQLFAPYLQGRSLTLTKVISAAGEKYHGVKLQNPDFIAIRRLAQKSERLAAYRQLRQQGDYAGALEAANSADAAEREMTNWEAANPDRCRFEMDDGQFFGFRQVGQARLERFTRFVLIPAVRDAELDSVDRKGSAIFDLMELVVRSSLARNQALIDLKQRTQTDYAALVSPVALPELGGLARQLTAILQSYVPSASVQIDWAEAAPIDLPFPKGQVKLEEDRFVASVDRVGHGLQRAFILSLLQLLASNRSHSEQENAAPGPDDGTPDLILAIEEPELFQHPNRQRHLARVLHDLSEGRLSGVARRTQVLYCTHSPLFVNVALFDSVRRFTKSPNPANPDLPHVSTCTQATADRVATTLYAAQDPRPQRPFTRDSLLARMAHLMGPFVNEGFFADVAVIVEGEEDRAAILGCAEQMGFNFAAMGIAVLPVGGKTNLDRPYLVFSSLAIPTVIVFDSDSDKRGRKDAHAETNQLLLRLVGAPDVTEFPTTCRGERYAVFDPNITEYLRSAAADSYEQTAARFSEDFGYAGVAACQKSPQFVARIVEESLNGSGDLRVLRDFVSQIQRLAVRVV
jgi:putative ATP-dependent endonuclease of OLD family